MKIWKKVVSSYRFSALCAILTSYLNLASKIILEYMKNQNRPYAVTDIITNLHGAVGKTLAIKVLAKLAEEDKLMAKTFGKTIIYVIKQVFTCYQIRIISNLSNPFFFFTRISKRKKHLPPRMWHKRKS